MATKDLNKRRETQRRCYWRNREKNLVAMKEYRNRPGVKERIAEKNKGKSAEYYAKNKEKIKLRSKEYRKQPHIRAKDKLRKKTKEYKEKYYESTLKRSRLYRQKIFNKVQREKRKVLDDSYIIALLNQEMGFVVKSKDIPHELIEIKRKSLQIKRLLKQKKDDN